MHGLDSEVDRPSVFPAFCTRRRFSAHPGRPREPGPPPPHGGPGWQGRSSPETRRRSLRVLTSGHHARPTSHGPPSCPSADGPGAGPRPRPCAQGPAVVRRVTQHAEIPASGSGSSSPRPRSRPKAAQAGALGNYDSESCPISRPNSENEDGAIGHFGSFCCNVDTILKCNPFTPRAS